MDYKDVTYGAEARAALKAGIDALADAVRMTLGPKGRNAVLDTGAGGPLVTNDGVTVAGEIELKDVAERQGARLVREVAESTTAIGGDGTTTATVLAQAIVAHGIRNVSAGADPMALKRGIEHAAAQVVASLREQSRDVDDPQQAARVATISAGDPEIGAAVGEAFDGVGPHGVVDVRANDRPGIELELIEGMTFPRGFFSPNMATDPEAMEAVLEEPFILISGERPASADEVLPLLDLVIPTGKPLLALFETVEGDALATFIVNTRRGLVTTVAVPTPEWGAQRQPFHQDLAILTGANELTQLAGEDIDDLELTDLGRAERVVVTAEKTTIVGGKGHPDAIARRVEQLEYELHDPSLNEYERNKYRERIARLSGRVASIRVGAATENELAERMHRTEDAVQATRAALHEGILPGGGVALLRAQDAIDTDGLEPDEATGAEVVRTALDEPVRRIAENAGFEASVVVARTRALPAGHGLDVAEGEYVDMIEAGVIDATRVTRSAFEHAASIAKIVLTTECLVTRSAAGDDLRREAVELNDHSHQVVQRPPRELKYAADARASLMAGIDAVADAVRVTLGPRGRNVLLARNGAGPTITNDGVTIAGEIELADPFANQGAKFVRHVALSTNTIAGDGTTTATILAQAIVRHGIRNVAAGADPMALRRGIEHAVDQVLASLREQSREVSSRDQVARVATISANDEEVGKVVADAIDRVGNDGALSVVQGHSVGLELELSDGLRFPRGLLHPDMVTDEARKEAVLDYPLILLVDEDVTAGDRLAPLLEQVIQTGQPLLVIAKMIQGDALQTLVTNKVRGILTSVAVVTPEFGDLRTRMLEDMAVLTDAVPVTADTGLRLETMHVSQLGRARKVIVDGLTTTIIGGRGGQEAVDLRIRQLRAELEVRGQTHFDKGKIRERLARLIGGVAVIKVGGPTETELGERLHRVEDAVQATRAARTEGILPGGGVALLNAQEAIVANGLRPDEATGAEIVRQALEEPLRQIAYNAGLDPSVVVARVRALSPTEGLDASTGAYCDLVAAGVIDPTMVTRAALEHAASVAKNVLTAECIVSGAPMISPQPEGAAGEGPTTGTSLRPHG